MKYLVTGGTSGLGKEVVRLLSRPGNDVTVIGRSRELFDELVHASQKEADIQFVSADFMDLREVTKAAQLIREVKFDGVFLNAGINSPKAPKTAQGFEPHFGVNVLAHELILRMLEPMLSDCTLVVTASNVQDPAYRYPRLLGIPLPNWSGPKDAAGDLRNLSSSQRYSNSKLGSVLLALSAQRRAQERGAIIRTVAFDPGLMMDTALVRDFPRSIQPIYRSLEPVFKWLWTSVRSSSDSAAMVIDQLVTKGPSGFVYIDGQREKIPPNPVALNPEQLAQYELETVDLLAEWI